MFNSTTAFPFFPVPLAYAVLFLFDDSLEMLLQWDLDLTNYSFDHYNGENSLTGIVRAFLYSMIVCINGQTLFPLIHKLTHGIQMMPPKTTLVSRGTKETLKYCTD